MTILSRSFPTGRLGNSLFQYIFLRALAYRNKTELALPPWAGSQYFSMKWNEDKGNAVHETIKEPSFDYSESIALGKYDKNKNHNFSGYWQSEKYFEKEWAHIKEDLRFNKRFLEKTIRKSELSIKDNYVATHLRRGDYIGNTNYITIPVGYYTDYIAAHPHFVFYVFTDDYAYCRLNFEKFPNVVFMDGYSSIEHLALMSLFKKHFISN